MSEHERIFLSPQDEADPYEGRLWCEDDGNWESPGVEFIRVDLHEVALAAAHRAGKLESLREIEQATFARWASVDDVRRSVRARIAEIENEGKDDGDE